MANIIAFAGSNSSTSINHQLIQYTAGLVQDHKVRVLKMSDYPFPMFSEDLEREEGYLNSLIELKNDFLKADALIISVNEHNGMVSAYFKNLVDWLSRIERKFLQGKKLLLMSTSGGKRGGISALTYIKNAVPVFGGEVIDAFSLPGFHQNFSKEEKRITHPALDAQLKDIVANFTRQI